MANAQQTVTVVAQPKGKVEVVFPPLAQLREEFGTKSAVIRYLATNYGHGKDGVNLTGAIAKHLDIRYQHVRNVLTQELKVGPRDSRPVVVKTAGEESTVEQEAVADEVVNDDESAVEDAGTGTGTEEVVEETTEEESVESEESTDEEDEETDEEDDDSDDESGEESDED